MTTDGPDDNRWKSVSPKNPNKTADLASAYRATTIEYTLIDPVITISAVIFTHTGLIDRVTAFSVVVRNYRISLLSPSIVFFQLSENPFSAQF